MIDWQKIDDAMSEGMAARGATDQTLSDAIGRITEGDTDWVMSDMAYSSLIDIDINGLADYADAFSQNACGSHAISALHEVHPDIEPWEMVHLIVASAFVQAFQAGVQAQITYQKEALT